MGDYNSMSGTIGQTPGYLGDQLAGTHLSTYAEARDPEYYQGKVLVERPVLVELDLLDKTHAALKENLGLLAERLSSVRNLSPERTSEDGSQLAVPSRSQVTDRIANARYRVEDMQNTVNELLRELEV